MELMQGLTVVIDGKNAVITYVGKTIYQVMFENGQRLNIKKDKKNIKYLWQ